MKARKMALTFLAAGSLLWAAGCDDGTDDVTQAVIDQQARQAAAAEKALPKIPTTHELISGPRTTMALGPLPLTMRVPTSWKISVTSGATLLQGYTPGATEVAIQLSSRPTLKKDELDAMIRGARKEQAEEPDSILKVDLRPFGNGMQIYERQGVGEPREYQLMDSTGKVHTSMEQPFRWTVSVLAPHGDAFQVYELNFVGLTKSQYDKDKDFLQGLLDTLSHGSGGGATTSPAAPLPGAGSGTGASPPPVTLP